MEACLVIWPYISESDPIANAYLFSDDKKNKKKNSHILNDCSEMTKNVSSNILFSETIIYSVAEVI